MATQIFVNVPVSDLKKSITFFEALGYRTNPQFTDKNAACIVIDDNHVYAMLLTHEFFKRFTTKEIVDATKATEVLTALSMGSREEVDEIATKALNVGGTLSREEDLGFMYTKAIQDLDGHVWEFFYMDLSKAPQAQ